MKRKVYRPTYRSNAQLDSTMSMNTVTGIGIGHDYSPPTDLICQLQPEIIEHDRDDNETSTSTSTLPHLHVSKHIYYVKQLVADLSKQGSYEGAVTEHLCMSGIYWSLTTLHILLPSTAHVNAIMNVIDTTSTTPQPTTMQISSSNINKELEIADSTIDNTITSIPESAETSRASKAESSSITSNSNDSPTECVLDWIWTCYDDTTGSFGGNTGQDGHILYTLSALQIIIISTTQITSASSTQEGHARTTPTPMDPRLSQHRDTIIQFIQRLQQHDGSFVGDLSDCGEIDTRFTYCAFQSLVLLNAFSSEIIDIPKAIQYILQCHNASDGGFGSCIGAESHAGQVFCCIGALAIAQALDQLYPQPVSHQMNDDGEPPDDVLGWWLCERQVDSGGLNGRPEKQADVCYSWWILSSLSILGKVPWINTNKLANYILKCQDIVDGGIADRPDDMADVFHTFFGIAGLSLLGHLHRADQVTDSSTTHCSVFRSIDPLYAIPTDICQQLQLPGQVMVARPRNGTTPIIDARLQHYSVYYYD